MRQYLVLGYGYFLSYLASPLHSYFVRLGFVSDSVPRVHLWPGPFNTPVSLLLYSILSHLTHHAPRSGLNASTPLFGIDIDIELPKSLAFCLQELPEIYRCRYRYWFGSIASEPSYLLAELNISFLCLDRTGTSCCYALLVSERANSIARVRGY